MHTLGQNEALRVAKVFAAANKADITDTELLAYLRDDPTTTVICLQLESITDARQFFTEARKTTPVKTAIGGRTRRRGAMSHTAALATDDAVPDASLRQVGVVPVRPGLQVLDAARALSGHLPPAGGGLRW
jgi:acyl-CoA synthetase (NDP forming)